MSRWEKKKLLVTRFLLFPQCSFSFSHSVFKRHVLQTRKNQGLFGKSLKHLKMVSTQVSLHGLRKPTLTKRSAISHFAAYQRPCYTTIHMVVKPLPDDKNFGLVQTETNCRRHFKVHSKGKLSII